jgi:predicted exporter
VPSRADAGPLVKKLRDADQGKPERQRLFSQINSIDDILPADQEQKLEVLNDIRRLIDRAAPKLTAAERVKLERLRPPADLRPVNDADVPTGLAWPYTERDGSRGRIILANNGLGINSSDTRDIRKFAAAVRGLDLSPEVLIGGAAFVFVDILDAMERDGPRATGVAALGALVVILVLLGPNRFGATTLFCGLFGTLSLLAFAWVFGLKVNVLDFVALPITIGIGIDYAVNIVSRERAESVDDATAAHGLAATATAVAVCSYTTIVGYGSLLISQNRGIRSFGLCAMLGEISCLSCALLVAPALVRAFRTGQAP